MSGSATAEADGVAIQISPSVIAMDSKGGCVSIHTNVALSAVATDTLDLDGLKPYLVKADARGQLVAKFSLAAVKAIVAPPSATLTLTGSLKDGTAFAASDTAGVKR